MKRVSEYISYISDVKLLVDAFEITSVYCFEIDNKPLLFLFFPGCTWDRGLNLASLCLK